MKKTRPLFLLLSCLFALGLNAQTVNIVKEFDWNDSPNEMILDGENVELWMFAEGKSVYSKKGLPVYQHTVEMDTYGELNISVVSVDYEPLPLKSPHIYDGIIGEELQFETNRIRNKYRYWGGFSFVPVIKKAGQFQRVTNIELEVSVRPGQATTSFRGPNGTMTSVLSSGDIYKIEIDKDGVYKMDYNFLKNTLNIAVDDIDPRKIQLFGNGGGVLPSYVEENRIDDLEENAIWIEGESDGNFDSGDYILFYAQGADEWTYDEESEIFHKVDNIYADKNYYFLKISNENGKRTALQENLSAPSGGYIVNDYDGRRHFEETQYNVFHEDDGEAGSGTTWFGDFFKVNRTENYNNLFSFPNVITTVPAKVKSRMGLRADQSSKFTLSIGNNQLVSTTTSAISDASNSTFQKQYGSAIASGQLPLNGEQVNVSINVPWPAGASKSFGWLDYITVNARQQLIANNTQLDFRDINSLEHDYATFQLSNANGQTWVWDVTNPLAPKRQAGDQVGSNFSFTYAPDTTIREYVAFNKANSLLTPSFVAKIENQNLHGITDVDLIILYHPDFEEDVMTLAQHRHSHDDLAVATVNIKQLYNEFSSGKQDPTAIRDFGRLLKQKSDRFKFLLLYGDGSFDYKNTYNLGQHFIPTFEKDSNKAIGAYPADDYFGIYYHESAINPFSGALDVSVGRLLVNTTEESKAILNKIMNYDLNEKSKNSWRTKYVFLADDEDSSGHLDDADGIANIIYDQHKEYNVEKLYIDAFEQEPTPAGPRSPLISNEINKNIFKGTSVIAYLGHGGPLGWAQERILEISQIKGWENIDHLPLFLTATCTFTGFDDPSKKTAGEEVFLNKKGGAIALLTTTRPVYAHQNEELTRKTIQAILAKTPSGKAKTFGEIVMTAKNNISETVDENTRKFTLIGDPSQRLAQPFYDVKTTSINGIDPQLVSDTISALEQVTINGAVYDLEGQVLESFNGFVYPTIYDKEQTFTTLGQDGSPLRNYKLQKRVIFKGKATVNNGLFSFTFIVPKDIDYEYGKGKISYYAASANNDIDAAGYTDSLIIGGANTNGIQDDTPPIVEVYMNTEDFVSGGTTDADPVLLVKLKDDYGINIVGNSIGHDLEGILDEDVQNSLILNDFYESEADNSTAGTIRFPLNDLAIGRHQIKVKAWDIANNLGEGYTEFVVAGSEEIALEHVLNYPNPFIDKTCIQFDSNLANNDVDVQVRIYTVSGRLVKTIEKSFLMDGSLRRDDCIEWDGTDDFNSPLARGTYIYKVHIQTINSSGKTLQGESKYEKMVILK